MRGESAVPGRALNLISTNYRDHGHHGRLPLSRKNAHGRAENHTRDLMVSSQELWPPSHEAGQGIISKQETNKKVLKTHTVNVRMNKLAYKQSHNMPFMYVNMESKYSYRCSRTVVRELWHNLKLRRPESKFLNPKRICSRWWLMYRFIVAFVGFNNGNTCFVFAFTLSFTPRKPKDSATYVGHLWFHPKVEKWQ